MAIIKSGASGDFLTIDSVSNAARATLYDADGNAAVVLDGSQPGSANIAGVPVFGLNDEQLLPMRIDRFGGQALAWHTPLLHESFEGTTINPIRWTVTATTMAATQSTVAGLTMNSGSITTVTTGYMLQSTRRFLKNQRSPLQAKLRARLNRVNNNVMELGFGDAATFNGANTAGAYWQVTSGGVVQPVLTFNSVDITGANIAGSLNTANYYTFDVLFDDDEAVYVCQDTSTGLIISRQSIPLSLTQQRLLSATQLPVMVRCYNSGVAPASAPQLILTDVYVLALDANQNKPWSHVVSAFDRATPLNPFTGAQIGQWANSAAPANATLSNTAAGYTTLGGLFAFAAVAGAATDYALFGFQVPTPANLMVTGIDIDTWNTGAAVATTPTLLVWGAAVGSTAVSLATATVNRIGLGAQSLPVAAAIGAKAERVSKQFQTPLNCSAARFLHIILRMPVGTATASQVVAGMVNIEGYFE
jgi:hypothetical protein